MLSNENNEKIVTSEGLTELLFMIETHEIASQFYSIPGKFSEFGRALQGGHQNCLATSLTIVGVCQQPLERSGERLSITFVDDGVTDVSSDPSLALGNRLDADGDRAITTEARGGVMQLEPVTVVGGIFPGYRKVQMVVSCQQMSRLLTIIAMKDLAYINVTESVVGEHCWAKEVSFNSIAN